MQRLFNFLDAYPWAKYAGIALGIFAVGYIEAHPAFPYSLFPG